MAQNKIRKSKIKYTTAYPTSLVIGGLSKFGYELASSLTEQGGYVIIIDNLDKELDFADFSSLNNIAFLDYTGIPDLLEQIRRLDYVFYLNHHSPLKYSDYTSQDFLAASSYLNQILNLAVEFEALFTLTNSVNSHRELVNQDKGVAKYAPLKRFSDVEFVRYSENLVLEYIEMNSLNAKIARLGEIIGEGSDLDQGTSIGRMVGQAAAGGNLYINEDGLGTEYYVHLLDAVYGVIKLQFTRDVAENVYTIAYPEAYTELSLAYRIKDLEPSCGEIKFVDGDTTNIRFNQPNYKPAPNLEKLGWRPKIDFEQSLVQTLAFAKNMLEMEIGEELDTFISPDRTMDMSSNEGIANGALARLIEERKQNADQQKQKYNKSLQEIELRKRKKPLGFRMRQVVLKKLDRWKKKLKFLENITLLDLSLYTLLLGIFLGVYFTVISPVIIMTRDIIFANHNIDQTLTAIAERDWQGVSSSSTAMRGNFESFERTLDGADLLIVMSGQENLRGQLLAIAQSFQFFAESTESYGQTMQAIENYSAERKVTVIPRLTNASVLSIDESQATTASEFEHDINSINANIELSQRAYRNYLRTIERLDVNALPMVFRDFLDGASESTAGLDRAQDLARFASGILSLVNRDNFNIGIVIQDEMRPNYGGGEVVGVGMLTYSGGALNSISMSPVDSVSIANVDLDQQTSNEIERLSGDTTDVTEMPAEVKDRYLFGRVYRDNYWKAVLSETYNRRVDAVLFINTSVFTNYLRVYPDLVVNNQQLQDSTYLQTISSLQTNSMASRNRIVTNITALLFQAVLSLDDRPMVDIFSDLDEAMASGKVRFDSTVISQLGISDPGMSEIVVGVFDPEPEQFLVKPELVANVNNVISTNNSVTTTINLSAGSGIDAPNYFVCFDRRLRDLGLDSVSVSSYRLVNLDSHNCVIMNTQLNRSVEVSYRKDIQPDTYLQGIATTSAIRLRYDVQTNYPSDRTLVDSTPTARRDQTNVFYTGETTSKFDFNLEFKNNE